MASMTDDLLNLNKIVYINLDNILKKLNKRLNIKCYSILLGSDGEIQRIIRIKNLISKNNREINQEEINNIYTVFSELDVENNIPNLEEDFVANLQEYFNERKYDIGTNRSEIAAIESISSYDSIEIPKIGDIDERIFYVNTLSLLARKSTQKVIYIIEISNITPEQSELFYKTPQLSFVRMNLDFYFLDYFSLHNSKGILIDKNGEIGRKYNEDSIQFTRRMTRLFFGKSQNLFYNNQQVTSSLKVFNDQPNNQYYINNLLEKIDDISTRTYENSSPFGCILFLNKGHLQEKSKLIHFTIKFQSQDCIELEDSKLIRKLLELTDSEKDLYLISDGTHIYGLGEIKWSELEDQLLLKVEFKGISKYSLSWITIRDDHQSNGKLVTHNEQKVYRFERNLKILSKELINVVFKSPKLGEEGYSPEKFKAIMRSQFLNEAADYKFDESIKYLERIVRKSKEQKHGTMVVITDYDTAVSELVTLKKQSTLIEPTKIDPEYIKFITSIDGAIYFDIHGKCHAIGVILDGIARENLGDSSRGARFNSAYRYFEKITDLKKKCLIVVISEDGIVDLIPELDNEEKLYMLFQEFIDLINQEAPKKEELIVEIERNITGYKYIDYHLFFKVAEAFYNKKNYEKAAEYFQMGIEGSGKNYVAPRFFILKGHAHGTFKSVEQYNAAILCYREALTQANTNTDTASIHKYIANSYFYLARMYPSDSKEYKDNYLLAIKEYDEFFTLAKESKIDHHFYNNRAISLECIGDLEKNKIEKKNLYLKAKESYTNSINLKKSNVLYSNRSGLNKKLGLIKECLEDLIFAELIASNSNYIKKIKEIIKDSDLFREALIIYSENRTNSQASNDLEKFFEEFHSTLKVTNPEVAVTLEEYMKN
ncbi:MULTISPECIES: diadenylate cyclase [Paenibacillus]|uniref:diadenylate cyclase n=1 Tax=Paenibacillus TaxID=44249 RepID=UPI002FE34F3B